MHSHRDPSESFGTVIYGVHCSNDRQQNLSGANVAGGLASAYVLFSGLQCHAKGGISIDVLRYSDYAPRNATFVLPLRCEERRVGTSVTQRHAKPLRITDRNVCAPLTGRCEQR